MSCRAGCKCGKASVHRFCPTSEPASLPNASDLLPNYKTDAVQKFRKLRTFHPDESRIYFIGPFQGECGSFPGKANKDWKALFSLAGTGKTNENAPCHSLHYNRARTNKSNCLPFLASGLYRWPRSLTGSALFGSGRGLYRQWGIAPRPETNFLRRV